MFLKKRNLEKMKKKFEGYNSLVIFIDGACTGNPGPAAASACFFGRNIPQAKQGSSDTDFDTEDEELQTQKLSG